MVGKNRIRLLIVGIGFFSLVWVYLLWTMSFWDVTREFIRLIVLFGTVVSPFFGIASFIFFLPIIPDTYESIDMGHGIPDLTWPRLLSSVLLVSTFFHIVVSRKLRERMTVQLSRFDQVILLFALVMFASIFYSKHIADNIEKYSVIMLIPLLMYFFIRMFVTSWKRVRIIFTVILVSSILISLVMIFQGITRTNYFYNLWYPSHVYSFAPPWESLRTVYQAPGIVANQNVNGMILIVTWALGIFLFRNTGSKFLKALCLIYFAVSLPAIFYSYSRKTWIGLILVLVTSFWTKARKRYLIPVCVVMVGFVSLHYMFFSREIVEERILSPSTLFTRFELAQVGLNMFMDSPLIGHGFNEYSTLVDSFRDGVERLDSRKWISHNSYVTKLSENGVLGISVFLLAIIYPVVYVRGVKRDFPLTKDVRDYFIAFQSISIFYLLAALVANVFENIWLITYYFGLAAIAYNLSRQMPTDTTAASPGKVAADRGRIEGVRTRKAIRGTRRQLSR